MTALDSAVSLPALAALRDQISALNDGPAQEVRAGHLGLGPDLWLSCDPDGQTRMVIAPDGAGLRLTVEAGDTGRWSSIGMRLQPAELQQARSVGLALTQRSAGLISFRPTLRYFLPEGGFHDVSTPDPVVMAPGARDLRSHVPVDAELAARVRGCELNIFLLDDGLCAEDLRFDPLLML